MQPPRFSRRSVDARHAVACVIALTFLLSVPAVPVRSVHPLPTAVRLIASETTGGGSAPHAAWPAQTGSNASGVPTVWTNVTALSPRVPTNMLFPSVALDPASGTLVLFGGCPDSAPRDCPTMPQTWSYVYSTHVWTQVLTPGGHPTARYHAQMVYDSLDGYVVLFGGAAHGLKALGDTWTFSGGVWTNLTANQTTPPPARFDAAMTYDPADREVVMFGGRTVTGGVPADLNDTWVFTHGLWRKVTAHGPTPEPRDSPGFFWDDVTSSLLLMDGTSATSVPFSDIWGFRAGRWVNQTSWYLPLPPARWGAAIWYDAAVGSAFLLGGQGTTGAVHSDTWALVGHDWYNVTPVSTISPSARAYAAVPPDTEWWVNGTATIAPASVVVSGWWFDSAHLAGSGTSDTWTHLESPNPVAVNATPAIPEAGQRVKFNASIVLGSPVTFHWDFGDGRTSSLPTPSHVFLAPGPYAVALQEANLSGGRATGVAFLAVDPGPQVNASVVPSGTDVGIGVTFTASGSLGFPPYGYQWFFNDGSNLTGNPVRHTYAAPASLRVIVVLTDARGASVNNSTKLTVSPYPTVNVSYHVQPSGTSGIVTFDPVVRNGTSPYTYLWGFGDATTSTQAVPVHPYARAGTYNVSVRVTDVVGGTSQQNLSVTVGNSTNGNNPPPPSVPTSSGGGRLQWLLGPQGQKYLEAGVAVSVLVLLLLVVLWVREARGHGRRPKPLAPAPVPPPFAPSQGGRTPAGTPASGGPPSPTRP